MSGVATKYEFKCSCGERMRMYAPDHLTCPTCNEPMELTRMLKIYPGYGIGSISIRAAFRLGDMHKKGLDNEGEIVV